MRAIVVKGPHNIQMEEVDIRPLKDGEILIKVVYAGICATDLAIYTSETSFVEKGLITYPCRIGHEWSGIVEALGKDVKDFKKGDRVITDNGVSCGECIECQKGNYGLCPNTMSVGTINCWDGCFADYMIMPDRHTYHIADSLSLKEAVLSEPLSISLASLKKCNITKDTKLAIIGTGSIGLGTVALASFLGAGKITVIGRTDFKLEKAKECGANYIINSKREDLAKDLDFDYVIETSGNPETVMQAIDIVKKRGSVILAGFYERPLDSFNIDTLVEKEVILKGVMGEYGLVPEVAKYLEKGLKVSSIITHCIDFDETCDFFRNQKSSAKERIKALVKINGQ